MKRRFDYTISVTVEVDQTESYEHDRDAAKKALKETLGLELDRLAESHGYVDGWDVEEIEAE